MGLDRHIRNFSVPSTLATDAIQEALQEHERLLTEHKKTERQLVDLRKKTERAKDADREAYADALTVGGQDPGIPETDALAGLVAESERKIDALELALSQTFMALVETVRDERDDLIGQAQETLDVQRSEYREALDAVEQTHRVMAETTSILSWLRRFPDGPPANPATKLAKVPGTDGRNGEDRSVSLVLHGLRSLADPAPERSPALMEVGAMQDPADATAHWASRGF